MVPALSASTLESRLLDPGASLQLTQVRRPGSVRGPLLLEARLTTTSHPLRVVIPFVVP